MKINKKERNQKINRLITKMKKLSQPRKLAINIGRDIVLNIELMWALEDNCYITEAYFTIKNTKNLVPHNQKEETLIQMLDYLNGYCGFEEIYDHISEIDMAKTKLDQEINDFMEECESFNDQYMVHDDIFRLLIINEESKINLEKILLMCER